MLQRYPAEIHGSQLVWTGARPQFPHATKVFIEVQSDQSVLAEADAKRAQRLRTLDAARGCVGRGSRQQVLAELAELRRDWGDDEASLFSKP